MTTTELIRAALAEADRKARENTQYREEFDADLSPADLARGTLGETWRQASSGPWKHAPRKPRRVDWLGWALLALAWAAAGVGLAAIFGGW